MIFAALFGNPNIEKVLLFLLVNEKCYASQLCRSLGGALTPIQQALGRLEQGGIVISSQEGKTRLFRFNPHYPFLRELEALLKQGYHHLTVKDQQAYYSPQNHFQSKRVNHSHQNQQRNEFVEHEALSLLWQHLLQIKQLSFSAQSKADHPSGWNGIGKAKVEVQSITTHTLMFQEQGSWTSEEGQQYDFKNVFRWTWQATQSLITLEHLRHGPDHPVVLFELSPVSLTRFETIQPFICRQDTYLANLYCDRHFIQLHWRILGPRKNEEIHYLYT
jgi:DNA-binding transcriptional ArsR family regulator